MSSIRVFTFASRRLVEVQHGRVDTPERELAASDPRLELRKHRLRVGAGQRPCLRDRHRVGESPERLGGHERAVDRQHDAHVVRGSSQSGDQPVHGRSLVRPVVENGKRQLERVSLLPDREHLVTDLVQEAPGALCERFSAEARERLRRPEALRRAADQEEAAERAHFCERNASRAASSSAFEGGGSESCGSSRSSSSRLRGAGPSADVELELSGRPK